MTCARCASDIETGSRYCRHCGAGVGSRDAARRLTRMAGEGKIGGVCAGIASYLDVDVTIIRLAWIVLSIVPGVLIGGVLVYLVAWALMPEATPAERRAPTTGRRLLRSSHDSMIGGVCGGLAEYLGVDATLVRVIVAVLAVYPGAIIGGVIVYLIAWFVIPASPFVSPAVSSDSKPNPV